MQLGLCVRGRTCVLASALLMACSGPPSQRSDAGAGGAGGAAADGGGTGGAFEAVRWVDPLIGTDGEGQPAYSYGGTIPSVTRPFGVTQWTAATTSADRPTNDIAVAPYYYRDLAIRGFLGTHQPALWMGDYGNLLLTPGMGDVVPGTSYPFKHENETALVNRYDVVLDAPQGPIAATITATERAGFLRWTFPAGQRPNVVLEAVNSHFDLPGQATVLPASGEIVTFNTDRQSANLGPALANFRGYFVAQFDPPFVGWGTWDDAGLRDGETTIAGTHVGAYVTFPAGTTVVTVRIGTSFISEQQARANLAAEIGTHSLDEIAADGRTAWNDLLGRVQVDGGTADQLKIFYTGLYHVLQYPRMFSEMGRYYSAYDDQVHDGVAYSDYSLWDTFRATHPLLLLVVPERVDDMITGLLHMYDEGGRLPMWPNPMETNIMIGTHADCVIADAFVKGFRNYDVAKAYQAVRFDATTPPPHDDEVAWFDRMEWVGAPAPPHGDGFEARGGLTWYRSQGFIPQVGTPGGGGYGESVSRMVEYGVDDFCVAAMARELAPEDVAFLEAQSKYYKNAYNPATGLLAPRNSDGTWFHDPNTGFTETGPWQYLFGAMHDLPGTFDMLGGVPAAIEKIDTVFSTPGLFDHTNEQGHHYSYLYDYAGQPWKTQEKVRHVMETGYLATPGGLIGNEDLGQMSAWYIMSALGFYPVTPASGLYAIGTPLFPRVVLNLQPPLGTGTLTVEAKNASAANVYVQSVELDGRPVTTPFLKHADLVTGSAKLVFTMGPQPNQAWGVGP